MRIMMMICRVVLLVVEVVVVVATTMTVEPIDWDTRRLCTVDKPFAMRNSCVTSRELANVDVRNPRIIVASRQFPGTLVVCSKRLVKRAFLMTGSCSPTFVGDQK
jgi:hypothetical protein